MKIIQYGRRPATDLLVVHASDTGPRQDIGAEEIRGWHVKERGWLDIGYHFVIRRDGTLERGRPEYAIGSHVAGHNLKSIGICLVGGRDGKGKPAANFTDAQYETLADLLSRLTSSYPKARVVGHRDLSPDKDGDGEVEPDEWLKACPCFDVASWWAKGPKGARCIEQ